MRESERERERERGGGRKKKNDRVVVLERVKDRKIQTDRKSRV